MSAVRMRDAGSARLAWWKATAWGCVCNSYKKWYRTGRETLQGKTHKSEHMPKTKGREAQKAGDHAMN